MLTAQHANGRASSVTESHGCDKVRPIGGAFRVALERRRHVSPVSTGMVSVSGSAILGFLNRSRDESEHDVVIGVHVRGVVAPALDKATRLSARLAHRAPLPIAVQCDERCSLGDVAIAGPYLVYPGPNRFGQYLAIGHRDHL